MKKDPIANSTKYSVTFEAPAEIQAESWPSWASSTTGMRPLRS